MRVELLAFSYKYSKNSIFKFDNVTVDSQINTNDETEYR